MDFKQQYKTEMQNISPTEEQCERIRAKVYEEIKDPQEAKKRKKPLPLKAIAITGASAACLVLVSALALQLLPGKVKLSGGAYDAAPNGMYAMEANRIDTADAVNEGLGDAAETETYDSASLDPTADGSAKSDSRSSSAAQTIPDNEKSGAAGQSGATEPLAPGSPVVKMVFSEDMSEFEVYKGKISQKYELSNEAPLTADNEDLLEEFPAVNSNIEKPLFIYQSGDKMWVYNENKQFIGCFIQN